jgi:hypothetical protein
VARYIQIVDWNKHQHYKHRNPPWVKWYSDLLERPELVDMPNSLWGVHSKLVLLASRYLNRIPFDERVLRRRYGITNRSIEDLCRFGLVRIVEQDTISEKVGIEVTPESQADDAPSPNEKQDSLLNQLVTSDSASATLAPCKQAAILEGEERDLQRERERQSTDSEGESEATAPASNVCIDEQSTNRKKLNEILSDKEITPLRSPYRESRRTRNGGFELILVRVERYVVESSLQGRMLDIDDARIHAEIAKVVDITESQAATAIMQLKDRKKLPLQPRRTSGASKP